MKTAKCAVSIVTKEQIKLNGLKLSSSKLSMAAMTETVLTIALQPVLISVTPIWKSSNPAVTDVSQDGVIRAKAPGNAVITVSASDGKGNTKEASCTVTVLGSVSTLTAQGTSSKSASFEDLTKEWLSIFELFAKVIKSDKIFQK